MGRSRGTHFTVEEYVHRYRGKPRTKKKKENLKYLSVDARVILKWKQDENIWDGFSRFGIKTSSNG